MKIILISNDHHSIFPLQAGGGSESQVENLCWGLHKRGIEFSVVCPKRTNPDKVPFDIIETQASPSCKTGINLFAREITEIAQRKSPDIILSQSHWSIPPLMYLGIPVLCTFHDGNIDRQKDWLINNPNIFYRFLSKYQYNLWVKEDWQKTKSCQIYPGFPEEEFVLDAQKDDYFLFVSSLFWGFQAKGGDQLIKLAKSNPKHRFVMYAVGEPQLLEWVKTITKNISNFEFRGSLQPGDEHRKIFSKAKGFLQLSQLAESFGQSTAASLVRGSVALGFKFGATPEIIAKSHGSYNTLEQLGQHLDDPFDYQSAYSYARSTFHIDTELDKLLKICENIITKREV